MEEFLLIAEIDQKIGESMNIELQQKLMEFAEEITENKTESRSKGLPAWNKKAGILPGDAPYLFSEILQILLRDDRVNYLKRGDLENFLWEFVLDIKTNPQRYSNRDDILYETERFYSEISKQDKEYKILLLLKNVGIHEEIFIKDFELRIFDQKLAEEWGLERELLEGEKEKVVLLTTVKANSFWKAIRRGKNKCFSFLALLQILPRIYKGSKISPVGYFMYIRTLPHNRIGWARLDGNSQKIFLPVGDDINYLEKWSDLLISHPTEMTRRVIAGIRLLAEAHTESGIVMKLIKVFMALETVFTGGKGGEKRSKLMFRVILFLSRRKRGFPFPLFILNLYEKRNDFMHEATETELSEVEQLELEKRINEIMYTSRDVYLELLKLMSENLFQNHNSFVSWLLEEDDTYKAVIQWLGEVAEERLEIALAAFNGKDYKLAKELFRQVKATYRSIGNSTKSEEMESYIKECKKHLERKDNK